MGRLSGANHVHDDVTCGRRSGLLGPARRSFPRGAVSAPAPPLTAVVAGPHGSIVEVPRGVAVLAIGDATGVAWPLAQALYADESIRPPLSESQARVLAGEAPPADAPSSLRDLAETRAVIHGDDAPSRQLLMSLASSLHVKAFVTVEQQLDATPSARLFLASTGAFDAARYAPEDGRPIAWTATAPIDPPRLRRHSGASGGHSARGSAAPPGPWG